jgi:predicted TIM-barrel fold metal-dependent hydrolase
VIAIVDGHHHIWRQADLPWLVGPMQPRIFGPYESIRRDYPIEEFRADLAGAGVAKSVYVQTNWAPGAYEDEAAWVQRTAERTGWPHAIVAYADFGADDVRPQLDRLSRYPLVRGARMQLHWHENPQYRFAARRDLVADPRIRRNVGCLADYGLSFDLQVFAPQMADAADLAESCPKVVFVLQHAGMLEDLSLAGRAEWRAGMVCLAATRMWSSSCPASAPSCTATIPRMLLRWSAGPSASSAPAGVCLDRTFRSRSSGPLVARSLKPIGTP